MSVPLLRKKPALMWPVWSALLAATPYTIYSAATPAPLQFGLLPLAIALIGAAFIDPLSRICPLLQGISTIAGFFSAVALFLIEVPASFVPQFQQAVSEQPFFSNALLLSEFLLASIALIGWLLAGQGDLCKPSPSSNHQEGAECLLSPSCAYALTVASASMPPSTPATTSPWAVLPFLIAGATALVLAVRRICSPFKSVEGPARVLAAILIGRLAGFLSAGEAVEYGFTSLWSTGLTMPWLPALPPIAVIGALGLRRHHRKTGSPPMKRTMAAGDMPLVGPNGADPSPTMASGRPEASVRQLSPREQEVLLNMAQGKRAGQIASDLGIAISTVSALRSRLYRKLKVKGKQELEELIQAGGIAGVDYYSDRTQATGLDPLPQAAHPFVFPFVVAAILFAVWLSDDIEHWLEPDPAFPIQLPYFFSWMGSILLLCASLVSSPFIASHRPNDAPGDMKPDGGPPEHSLFKISRQTTLVLITLFIGSHYWIWSFPGLMLLVALTCNVWISINHRQQVAHPTIIHSRLPGAAPPCPHGFHAMQASQALLLIGSSLAVAPILYNDGILADTALTLACVPAALSLTCLAYTTLKPKRRQQAPLNERDRQKVLLSKHGITGLQADVLISIASGATEAEICRSLCTTRNTVKSYRQRAYKKLGVHSVHELQAFFETRDPIARADELHPFC